MTARIYPSTYDGEFQRSTKRRLPAGFDWLRVKSQAICESDLNPLAVSPAGAEGIMQWMPTDFPEWRDKCGYETEVTAFMSSPAIDCACAYMAHLYGQWTAKRSEFDRWRLALASYNAGLEHILEAQRRADGAADYITIMLQLPQVTGGSMSDQTFTYVDRIARIHAAMQRPEAA